MNDCGSSCFTAFPLNYSFTSGVREQEIKKRQSKVAGYSEVVKTRQILNHED